MDYQQKTLVLWRSWYFVQAKCTTTWWRIVTRKNSTEILPLQEWNRYRLYFFAVKFIYLGYPNTRALFHWLYEILVALSNILPCFYKEVSPIVVLYPCVCPFSKRKFQTTLQGFHSIGTLDSGALDKCSLDLPVLLACRSPHSHMIWWRKNVQNIQMLSCAGPRKKLRTRVPGLMCSPASTPHLMDLEASGRCDACTWLIDIRWDQVFWTITLYCRVSGCHYLSVGECKRNCRFLHLTVLLLLYCSWVRHSFYMFYTTLSEQQHVHTSFFLHFSSSSSPVRYEGVQISPICNVNVIQGAHYGTDICEQKTCPTSMFSVEVSFISISVY